LEVVLYRNGRDSISWHSDGTQIDHWGRDEVIATAQFGVSRKFCIKSSIQGDSQRMLTVHQGSGDVYIQVGVQNCCQHSKPQMLDECGVSIAFVARHLENHDQHYSLQYHPQKTVAVDIGSPASLIATQRWSKERCIGPIQGDSVGDIFESRLNLFNTGRHLSMQAAMDSYSGGPCVSVCLGSSKKNAFDGAYVILLGHTLQRKDLHWDRGVVHSAIIKFPMRLYVGWECPSPFSPNHGYKYCGIFYVYKMLLYHDDKTMRYFLKSSPPSDQQIADMYLFDYLSLYNIML
jgi:hypothetical protein